MSYFDVEVTVRRISGLFGDQDVAVRWSLDGTNLGGQSAYAPVVSNTAMLNFKFNLMQISMGALVKLMLIKKFAGHSAKDEQLASRDWTVVQLPAFNMRPLSAAVDIDGVPGAKFELGISMRPAIETASSTVTSHTHSDTISDTTSDGDETESSSAVKPLPQIFGGRPALGGAGLAKSPALSSNQGGSGRRHSSKRPSRSIPAAADPAKLEMHQLRTIFQKFNAASAEAEEVDIVEFKEMVNKDNRSPLTDAQINAFFRRVDVNRSGVVTRVEVCRVLYDELGSDAQGQVDIIFDFLTRGDPAITEDVLFDILDDIFSNFSYRTSTSREPEVKHLTNCILEKHGKLDRKENKRYLDRASFRMLLVDDNYKIIKDYLNFLITDKSSDERVCVMFDFAFPFVPHCMTPSAFARSRRDTKQCTIL